MANQPFLTAMLGQTPDDTSGYDFDRYTLATSTATFTVKEFTPVALPFKDENGDDFEQILTPLCQFSLLLQLAFTSIFAPLFFRIRIYRDEEMIGSLSGNTVFMGTYPNTLPILGLAFSEMPGPVEGEFMGSAVAGREGFYTGLQWQPNNVLYLGTPAFRFPLRGGERVVCDFLSGVATVFFSVSGTAAAPFAVQLKPEGDKAGWMGQTGDLQTFSDYQIVESGYYVPTAPDNWKKVVLPVTSNVNGATTFAGSARVGTRRAPLNGIRAIYHFATDIWGDTKWKRVPLFFEPRLRMPPLAHFFTVTPARELVYGKMDRVSEAFNQPYQALYLRSFLPGTAFQNVTDYNQNPPQIARYLTALCTDKRGVVWALQRLQTPADQTPAYARYLSGKYSGPWHVAKIPIIPMSPKDYTTPEVTVWDDENIVYADLLLLRDGGACSVGFWVNDAGDAKVKFKRAPSVNTEWPADDEAVTIFERTATHPDQPSGLAFSYRLYEGPDGILYLVDGLGFTRSLDGGKTWE